jgi:hypothetical protein
MGAPAVSKKTALIVKEETTRGTAVAITGADFDVPFFNLSWTAEKPITDGKYGTGDFDAHTGVVGTSKGTISASLYLNHSGDQDTPPKCAKVFEMLGLQEAVNSGVSVVYTPVSTYEIGPVGKTFTCIIQDQMATGGTAIHHKFVGCLANGKILCEALGTPWRLDVEITGKYVGYTDETALALGTLDSTVPNSVKSATITVGGVVQRISKFELEIGNAIEMENAPSDATGFLSAVITDRTPILSIDPLVDTLATDAVYTKWNAGTEGAVVISTGNWALNASNAQIITVADGSQGALKAFSQTLRLNRDGTDGAWTLTHI